MIRFLAGLVFGLTGAASIAHAGEVAPMSATSVHLDRYDGSVYYTAEPDGYRVVATLAGGANGLPIRLVSTLSPGQRMMISVPQPVGQASVEFEIVRNGDKLMVGDTTAGATADLSDDDAIVPAAVTK